jgi:hypothetical protein
MSDSEARSLAHFRRHFARLWPEREREHVRSALRDNVRGQRQVQARR